MTSLVSLKHLFKKSIVIAASMLAAVAYAEEPADLFDLKALKNIQFLSSKELTGVESLISKLGARQYAYHVVRVKSQEKGYRELLSVEKDKVSGLALMRNKKHLAPLGGLFYDDGLGNLLYFGGPDQAYTMNYMANGQNILAVDADGDSVVDAAIGNIDAGDFWILSEYIEHLLPCLSSQGSDMYGALLDCTAPGISGDGGGGGGGGLPGGSDKDIFDHSGLLGDPDCGPEDPGSVVTGDKPGSAPGEDRAPPPPPPTKESPDDRPMGVSEGSTIGEDGTVKREVIIRTADNTTEQYTNTNSDGSISRTNVHRDGQGRETYREDILVGPGPQRRLLMHRVVHTTYDEDGNYVQDVTESRQARSGSGLEPVNPDGSTVFKDPRCAGRETRNAQGLGFLDLCSQEKSTDFLGCYRNLESPLFNVSGGRCTVEPGPAGGEVLNCKDHVSTADCIAAGGSPQECENYASGSDEILGPGGSGSGPVDAGEIPGAQKIDTRFIDTVPLGAMLMGICSKGGCPDPVPF